ncbi:MAG: transcription antitermination factor NusB [Victivallaceae bacterium]|nr:transcription antitermination factor NusB [Victivallaceae bacterium]
MSLTTKKSQVHYRHLGREMALQFMFQCDVVECDDDNSVMERFWEQLKSSIDECDERLFRRGRRYAESLIASVKNEQILIDEKISKFSESWDIDRMTVVDRNIVRIAVDEMLFVPEIPPVVSIDEAVTLALEFSDERAMIFINGILNALKDSLKRPPREKVESLGKI